MERACRMTKDRRISVVMITHNRCNDVLRSLEMFHQLPEAPPIIVVDNASTDRTCDAIHDIYPDVQLIRLTKNVGTAARNLGVQQAQTPYVVLSDDDTFWDPGCVARAADILDAHLQLALIVGRVLIGAANEPDPICDVLENSPLERKPGMPGPALLGCLAGACAIRRSAFLQVGGFPTWCFLGGEEELLAVDLAVAGWWLCYVPELVIHHYPSPIRDTATRDCNVIRNHVWFAWMRRPLEVAFKTTLQVVRKSFVSRPARRALFQAISGLPRVLRRRSPVPPEIEQQLVLLESQRDSPFAHPVPIIQYQPE